MTAERVTINAITKCELNESSVPMNLKLVLSLLLSCVIVASPLAASQPNVVFIYTDDQAPFAVNAAGDHRFITPNIDKIFHGGAHLTNSFVTTPVCSPSRVGLISSLSLIHI